MDGPAPLARLVVRWREKRAFVWNALDGFVLSSVSIGLLRAWISVQTGILDSAATSVSELAGVNVTGVIILLALLACSVPAAYRRLCANRGRILPVLVLASAILYLACLVMPDTPARRGLALAAAIFQAASLGILVCYWCADNLCSDPRKVLVRLCLSFIAQFIAYSVVVLSPEAVQLVLAVAFPLLIGAFMGMRPNPVYEANRAQLVRDREPALASVWQVVSAGLAIFFCCAVHGLIFRFSDSVTDAWVLGSFAIACLCMPPMLLPARKSCMFMFMLLTMAVELASALLVLLSSGDVGLISLAKSLSYTMSMGLTFLIACSMGSPKAAESAGPAAVRWVALFFVAFYLTFYGSRMLGADPSLMLLVALAGLVLAAIASSIFGFGQTLSPEGPAEEDGAADTGLSPVAALSERFGLTKQETAVLGLLLQGMSNREISRQRTVTVNTTRSQIQAIYRKTGVSNRKELNELVEQVAGTRDE